jgi:hypothetical protein
MFRLPLIATGLGAASLIVAVTNGAFGDVNNALSGLSPYTNKGPLIIHITRSSELSQGAAEVLKQTRCLLEWQGGPQGQYEKQCKSAPLPR